MSFAKTSLMITLKDDNKMFDGHGGSYADAPNIFADWVLLSDFQMICRIFLQRNDSDSREIVKHSFILQFFTLSWPLFNRGIGDYIARLNAHSLQWRSFFASNMTQVISIVDLVLSCKPRISRLAIYICITISIDTHMYFYLYFYLYLYAFLTLSWLQLTSLAFPACQTQISFSATQCFKLLKLATNCE